jgi:nucleotide-binding universal stress UspA family protein
MTSRTAKIVVGTDFSPESEAAVRHAVALARRRDAEVVLLHAGTIPDLADPLEPMTNAAERYRSLVEADLRANRERLEELRGRFTGNAPVISHVVAEGFPDTTIPQIAAELGAETIVIGSHGRTGLTWLLLGSVARRVIRLAEADVLLARGPAPVGGYARIAVATDFSPGATQALRAAFEVAAIGARIEVVYAWNLPPTVAAGVPTLDFTGMRNELEADVRARGEAYVKAHERRDVDLRFVPVYGPPVQAITEHATRGGHDLVVLGSHGRRGLRRFVLGSVAEGVAAHARCSTLVVHRGPA